MDVDDIAERVIDAVGAHLLQIGADAVGPLANHPVDEMYRLVAGCLGRTPSGMRVVGALRQRPGDPAARRQARQVLADEARHDPQFADTLAAAAQRAGLAVNVRTSSTAFGNQAVSGASGSAAQGGRDALVGNRDVKITDKQFHIGSVRFGTGGLVGLLALAITLAGGSAAAVVTTTRSGPPAVVSTRGGSPIGCSITTTGVTELHRTQDPATSGENMPVGTYHVVKVDEQPWAGSDIQWFKINVNGRAGWVQDNPAEVESRSASCP